MSDEIKPIRRVVTGNDAQGRSRVLFDSAAPRTKTSPFQKGTNMTDIWTFDTCPAVITGERDDKPDGHGAVLTAVIEGRREGHAIEFRKLYDDLSRCDGFVAYSGTIYPDGNEISGRWEIAGVWSGTFIMIRKSGARETFAREAEERADQEAIAQVGTSVIARCVSAVAIQSRHLDCRAASPLAMTIFPSTGRIG